jgi:hypothetical protein
VARFAPHEDAHDLSMSGWTTVCEAAWRIAGGALEERNAPGASGDC